MPTDPKGSIDQSFNYDLYINCFSSRDFARSNHRGQCRTGMCVALTVSCQVPNCISFRAYSTMHNDLIENPFYKLAINGRAI